MKKKILLFLPVENTCLLTTKSWSTVRSTKIVLCNFKHKRIASWHLASSMGTSKKLATFWPYLIYYFVFTLPKLFCDVFYLLHLCVRFMTELTLMPLFSLWKIKRNFFQTRIYQLPSTPLNRKRLFNLQSPQLQI